MLDWTERSSIGDGTLLETPTVNELAGLRLFKGITLKGQLDDLKISLLYLGITFKMFIKICTSEEIM